MSATAAGRVTLRPFEHDDDTALRPWLGEAIAAVSGMRSTGATTPTDLDDFQGWMRARWPDAICMALISTRGVTGFLVWRPITASWPGRAAGATAIVALAVRRDARNLGYGAEAVELFEDVVKGDALLAPIPRSNGLAVYFWLRAGYRPVTAAEQADLVRDPEHLWMVRAASSDRSDGSPGC